MLKEKERLEYFTSVIGEKNVDVVLKNGITKEIFSYVYQECSKYIDATVLGRLENSQKDIKKLVEKELKEDKKRGLCDEVVFYYGHKMGSIFNQELENTVVFTNRTMVVYHKSIGGVKGILAYRVPYNDIVDIEYDDKSDTLDIKMIRGAKRSPNISHCKETYILLSHINELNRTIRIASGIIDSIYVPEGYMKPFTRLREFVGSSTFDLFAEMNYRLKKEYSLIRNKFDLNIDNCGFGFHFIARTGSGEEGICPGFIAFNVSKKHFYWALLRSNEKDVLHTIELNTIRNVWTENDVVYINYHYNDVEEIHTDRFARDILNALAAFVPTSDTWHKANARKGKLAKELDIERIKNSFSLASYEDVHNEIKACATDAGMNDYEVINTCKDKVDKGILAGYIWNLYLTSKIDEEVFWILLDVLLDSADNNYDLDTLYNYKMDDRKRYLRMKDEQAQMAIMIFDFSIQDFVRKEVLPTFGTKSVVYTHKDQDAYYFTDNETNESIPVKPFYLGSLASELVENRKYTLYLYENEVVLVR